MKKRVRTYTSATCELEYRWLMIEQSFHDVRGRSCNFRCGFYSAPTKNAVVHMAHVIIIGDPVAPPLASARAREPGKNLALWIDGHKTLQFLPQRFTVDSSLMESPHELLVSRSQTLSTKARESLVNCPYKMFVKGIGRRSVGTALQTSAFTNMSSTYQELNFVPSYPALP